jgi:hypothetical protein
VVNSSKPIPVNGSRPFDSDSSYNTPTYIAKYSQCVVEHAGTHQFTDVASSVSYLPTWNVTANSMSTSCTPTAKVVPLSKDTKLLKDMIDNFQASGTTAGQDLEAAPDELIEPRSFAAGKTVRQSICSHAAEERATIVEPHYTLKQAAESADSLLGRLSDE